MRRWRSKWARPKARSKWRFTGSASATATCSARRLRKRWPTPPMWNRYSDSWQPRSVPLLLDLPHRRLQRAVEVDVDGHVGRLTGFVQQDLVAGGPALEHLVVPEPRHEGRLPRTEHDRHAAEPASGRVTSFDLAGAADEPGLRWHAGLGRGGSGFGGDEPDVRPARPRAAIPGQLHFVIQRARGDDLSVNPLALDVDLHAVVELVQADGMVAIGVGALTMELGGIGLAHDG